MQEVKEPIVVTEGEAARLLSVSRAALRRWRQRDADRSSRGWRDVSGTTCDGSSSS